MYKGQAIQLSKSK